MRASHLTHQECKPGGMEQLTPDSRISMLLHLRPQFFILDDPVEAEMYMHGRYDMDSSDSQLVLVLINPDAIGIFDQSLILKAETADCSDVNQALKEIKYPEWYKRPKLDIKTQNEMLKALKQILEEKRALQA